MTVEEVEIKLIRQMSTILSVKIVDIKPELPLNNLGVDSLSFVELLVFIEKEFGIKLMESGITKEDFRTLRSLAQRISQSKG